MRTTRKARWAAAAIALALGLSACGSDDGDSGDGGSATGGTLTLGVIFPPTSMAPSDSSWANESPYMQAVYDTLIRIAPDGELEPWLATEWSYDDTKTELTMKLRTDVTFTDGTPFTADVAAQNLLRFRDGTSVNTSYLANLSDATAVDDETLQLTLSQPDPALVLYLGQNAGLQASPEGFGASDEKTNPIGSGPYILDTDQTVVGSKYVYSKNADYWAPDSQHYDELVINVLDAITTQVNAIQGDQVDGVPLADPSANEQVEASGYEVTSHELDWEGLILFDREGQLNPALADVRVRQAIAHAIDRGAILEAAYAGNGTVTGQIFGEGLPAFDESLDEAYPYDPDQATELLAEAGYADGLTIQMPLIQMGSTTVFDLVAQYLDDVGITVDYVPTALADAIGDVTSAKYAASWFRLQQDPTAWQTANFSISESATWNVFHVQDATVDELLATMQTADEAAADEAAQELNQYVVEQAWFVPFYRLEAFFATSPDTDVVLQDDNAYPYLENITPAA